ncbi:hypothetical protein [Bifidobacterium breve]|uniref:hypothetical protein n=1 Tax=Bifidobacterium breve TaxID=1685 RepID=UPI00080BE31F|nr:hypothetical protein [Bifidobacterium breve]
MNQKNGRTDPGPLRERARSLFISQATIDETLEWATPVFCQIFVGRFGVSFSPFERLFLGRFGFGQSCGLSVIA